MLMDALRRRGIDFALFRHEAHAGIAAAVYGRLSGSVGVVVTTLGPGASNLLLPIANSHLDCDPLLAISAQIPARLPASHTHQRLPLTDIFRPITKFTSSVTPTNCRRVVREAIKSSTTGPPGPSYLTLSAEDANAVVAEESAAVASNHPTFGPLLDARVAASTVRELLSKSERPLVIVGLGANASSALPLRSWLTLWSLPYAVTAKVKGIVNERSIGFVGVVGGMAMDDVMRDAIRNADLVIGFGLDPVEVDQTWHAETPIHWILEAPLATGRLPEERLIACSHHDLLAELNRQDVPRMWTDSFSEFRARRWPGQVVPESTDESPAIDPMAMISALDSSVPAETIVVTDVGSHKYLFGQFWRSQVPETFLVSNGLSAMGYGLPAAIGAKLARPDSPVLLAIGDGGFAMTSSELETAVRLKVPVVAIVLADRSYSLIRMAQESRGLPNFGVDFGTLDTVATAEACGMQAKRAHSVEELTSAIKAALEASKSLVVEAPVSVASYRGIV